jgi:hypothetical protein
MVSGQKDMARSLYQIEKGNTSIIFGNACM